MKLFNFSARDCLVRLEGQRTHLVPARRVISIQVIDRLKKTVVRLKYRDSHDWIESREFDIAKSRSIRFGEVSGRLAFLSKFTRP